MGVLDQSKLARPSAGLPQPSQIFTPCCDPVCTHSKKVEWKQLTTIAAKQLVIFREKNVILRLLQKLFIFVLSTGLKKLSGFKNASEYIYFFLGIKWKNLLS
jgi:hypothetical protein